MKEKRKNNWNKLAGEKKIKLWSGKFRFIFRYRPSCMDTMLREETLKLPRKKIEFTSSVLQDMLLFFYIKIILLLLWNCLSFGAYRNLSEASSRLGSSVEFIADFNNSHCFTFPYIWFEQWFKNGVKAERVKLRIINNITTSKLTKFRTKLQRQR